MIPGSPPAKGQRPEAPTFDWPGTEHALAAADRRCVLRTLASAIGGIGGIGALAVASVAPSSIARAASQPDSWVKPRAGAASGTLPFVRVWADANGRTQVERRDLALSEAGARGLFEQAAETFAVRVIPPGMFFDWHKPSRRRMVGVLRGSATMTLRDGTTATATPGMVLLVENTHGEGHRGNFDETDFTITFDVGLPNIEMNSRGSS